MFRIAFVFGVCVQFSYGRNKTSLLLETARDSSGWGWQSGTGLQSFFDIALTALAFLSFGIFLLNLLLNALMFTGTAGPTASGPIVTNTGTAGTGGAGGTAVGVATGFGRAATRTRRSPFDLYIDPIASVDALANSVLESIDAMVNKHECIQKTFCDGNHQAKIIGRGFQYIMPVYSFGASFIGEKLGLHEKLPDHMNAILLGIDESNCQSHFPHC